MFNMLEQPNNQLERIKSNKIGSMPHILYQDELRMDQGFPK